MLTKFSSHIFDNFNFLIKKVNISNSLMKSLANKTFAISIKKSSEPSNEKTSLSKEKIHSSKLFKHNSNSKEKIKLTQKAPEKTSALKTTKKKSVNTFRKYLGKITFMIYVQS